MAIYISTSSSCNSRHVTQRFSNFFNIRFFGGVQNRSIIHSFDINVYQVIDFVDVHRSRFMNPRKWSPSGFWTIEQYSFSS